MKRSWLLIALLLSAAGLVFLQTTSPAPKLASWMPSGALLYLESPDFNRLLRDWDASKIKPDWLESENYAVFERSNLFTKLQDVYREYSEAAGMLPVLKNAIDLAGTDSALALYGIRDVEFLYISRMADAEVVKSQLWAVRDQFEQRQAGGVSFYLRTRAGRTVAFALAHGYLFAATRDDLVAQALERLAGGSNPSVASERWYRDAVAEATNPGELRLVMNLDSLAKSDHFRSYWLQRNVPAIGHYWAGVADVQRSASQIAERRILLHSPENPGGPVANLVALVPPEAGLYRAWGIRDSAAAAALVVNKLIGSYAPHERDWREAPSAASPDVVAGGEADLETRIDEQPLPPDAGLADSTDAVRSLIDKHGAHSILLVQSTSPASGPFVRMSAAIVLEGATDWDRAAVRDALATTTARLWTTSRLGAEWTGGAPVERLNGLGTLVFANRGRLLFLGNDPSLLASVMARIGMPSFPGAPTYAAGFRHSRERANYELVMRALDPQGDGPPPFFSANLAALSRILSTIDEVHVTEEEKPTTTLQTVVYQRNLVPQ